MKDSQHQCESRHRLFTTREQENVLQSLARRLSDDINTRLENVVRLDQTHLATTASKHLLEEFSEILIYLLEGVPKSLARPPLDLSERLFCRRDAFQDILALRR